ncbi:hypothetical protein V6N13_087650 [Hibiscus sabdariffa]
MTRNASTDFKRKAILRGCACTISRVKDINREKGTENPNSRFGNRHESATARRRVFIALVFVRFRATAKLIGLVRRLRIWA